jgi:hypothetical protein
MRIRLCALLAAQLLAGAQTLSPEERLRTLKSRSLELLSGIPDYTCLETISRVAKGSKARESASDTIRVEVAVADHKEIYGWPQGERFSDQELAHMAGSGLTATGIYNGFARGLMSSRAEHFQFAGEAPLQGEAAFRYDFRIPVREGPWNISWDGQTGQAGERGSLWVDAKTLLLRRVEVNADYIPANIALTEMRIAIDFEAVSISDHNILLPATAWISAHDKTGKKNLSRVFFNHCRSFGSSSVLSFEPSEGAGAPGNPRRYDLPARLEVSATLKSQINLAEASAGDPLEAVVQKAIRSKGSELVPAGAVLEGHIRKRWELPDSDQYAVTVEFDRLQTAVGWTQFYGRMTALAGFPSKGPKGKKRGHALFDTAPDAGAGEEIAYPEIPGVTTIYPPPGSAAIPSGVVMTWAIEDFAAQQAAQIPSVSTGIRTN